VPALLERANVVHDGNPEPTRAALIAIGEIHEWSLIGTKRALTRQMMLPAYVEARPETTLTHLVEILNDKHPGWQREALAGWRRLAEEPAFDVLERFPDKRAQAIKIGEERLGAKDPDLAIGAVWMFRVLAPDQAEKIIPTVVRLTAAGRLSIYDA